MRQPLLLAFASVFLLFTGLLVVGWLGTERQSSAYTLTHQEKVSMCNDEGKLFADGVCQRIYINLCRRE